MSSNISQQPLMATFFAYFDPRRGLDSRNILFLICCPVHRSEDVRQKLENAGLTRSEATSREYLIPRHDKAFVFVSGGIDFARSQDKGHFYLRLVQTLSKAKTFNTVLSKYYLDKSFWFVLYHPCSTDVPEMARVYLRFDCFCSFLLISYPSFQNTPQQDQSREPKSKATRL